MDPQTQMQAQPTVPPEPPKRRLLQKKILLTIVIVIISALGVFLIMMTSNKGDNSKKTSENNMYYDRPGYDRDLLGTAIGDPAAARLMSSSEAIQFQGSPVVQACNIITMEDITKQGLLLRSNTTPTVISRTFSDGVGKAGYDKVYDSNATPSPLELAVNNCRYGLEAETSMVEVSINVLQPFAFPESLVDKEIGLNFTPTTSVQGLEAFIMKRPTSTSASSPESVTYILMARSRGSIAVTLQLPTGKEDKRQALLDAAAQNFIRELNAPTGSPKLSYDSPVFSKSFASACDLIDNEDIRTLTGKDAGTLVQEGIATSVGVLDYTGKGGGLHNYIENECSRYTIGDDDVVLRVTTTSYLDDQPAKIRIEEERHTNLTNLQNIPVPGVGDEAVAYTDPVGNCHLLFRKGRILVDTRLYPDDQQALSLSSLAAAAEKLAPISQTMASRVKD